MNPSTNRPRRKRGKPSSSDNNDGDIYVPSSSRSTYNMNRDGPSSHVDSQERFYKHSSDAHHRSSRDEYDATDSRDADQWSAHKGGREWSPREFERSHTSFRRGDGQGWGTSTFNDDRSHPDRESPDWRRGDQDDDRDGKWDNKESRGRGSRRWQSDKGWDTRKRDRNQNRRPLDNPDESAPSKEDRFWEPGPGWQSRGADQGHRNQRPRNNVQGKNKGKKQVQSRQRQRGDKDRDRGRFPDRDRRQNEDTLNNWQRREIHPLPPKPRSPIKRALTPSRSRSRTPDSLYSRRSSRSRSRSRSYSPRPNTCHSSPPRARSPSPLGRRCGANRSRSPASSQRSYSQRGRPRRRSISSFSSYSGSRSRSSSRSGDDRPKAKHRLPPATSIKDISLSISKTSLHQRSEFLNSREPDTSRNGKVYANGKQRNHRPLPSEAERRASLEMPPPSDAHSTTTSRVQHNDSATSPVSQRHEAGSPTKARFGFSRSAGFKPIGQASSSVKMFFPQDDEESEARRSPPDADSPPRTEIPIKRARKDISTDRGEDDRESTQEELAWHSKVTGIEPPPPPSLALRDATKAPLSPKHARSSDVTTSPGLQTRLPEQEVDGITRPSSPTPLPKELYAIVSQVGEGTFGKVYKARNTITNVHVALKRIRMEAEKDGFPVTAMREIKLLQSLRHQNVVRLYEMMVSNGSVFMVFEYMDHDLTGVLSQTQFSFSAANLKSLCSQMLAGLAYLHHKGVIHRDIKGSNILINNRGELKLADFGLARFYQKRRRSDYTNRVITLWYRPPELLFGATIYGPEVDMWSAGCIMLELFTKKPVFQGNDEIHQLEVIYRIFGTPTTDRWPGITELPWYELVKPKEAVPDHFRELFQRWLSPAALDLAERLLTYDPTKRVTALQALEAPYFTVEQPPPELPVGLSSLEGEWHELETKRERAKKRRKLENSLQQHVV